MKTIYILGSILLFLGLLWMFLPHTTHQVMLNEEEEISPILHILEGVVVAILGLGIMLYGKKRRRLFLKPTTITILF